jgi:flavin-dependent dehydrogenase
MKNPVIRSEEFNRYPIIDECDVLVCGGGPSGFSAAVSAARNGAKTILVERYGFPGGMMTAGYVNPIYGFFSRHIQVVRGIGHEFINELIKIKGATTNRENAFQEKMKSIVRLPVFPKYVQWILRYQELSSQKC